MTVAELIMRLQMLGAEDAAPDNYDAATWIVRAVGCCGQCYVNVDGVEAAGLSAPTAFVNLVTS